MKSVCFSINLANGDKINVVECYLTPEAEKERFPQCFAEACLTGVLITGTPETRQFIIPMENVLFVERIPNFDEDEGDEEERQEEASADGKSAE